MGELANTFDTDELEGVTFFGKDVLDLDRDELLSLAAHLVSENERLEELKATSDEQVRRVMESGWAKE